jgi:hypothetical protein
MTSSESRIPSSESRRPNGTVTISGFEEPLILTAKEWKLIMEALSSYQHHRDFRPLYERLVVGQNRS